MPETLLHLCDDHVAVGEHRRTLPLAEPFLLRLRQILRAGLERPQRLLATSQFFFDTPLRFTDHQFAVGQRPRLLPCTEQFPRRRGQVVRPRRHRSQRFLTAVQRAANFLLLRFPSLSKQVLGGVDQLFTLHESQDRAVLVGALELHGAENLRAGRARPKRRLLFVELPSQPALRRRDDQLALGRRR